MNAITPPLNGITATATTTTSTVALPPIEANSTQYPMRVRIAASAPVVIRIYGDATSNSMLIGPGDATMVKTYGCTTVSMQALSGTARVNIQAIPDAFWLPGFVPFNPATQFAGGQQGAWYDPGDYSTLFQGSFGVMPVTAMAQPVGRMLDKSGRSNAMGQATATSRPLTNSAGSIKYLTFDGIDDSLATGAITLTADMDCFIAIQRKVDTNMLIISSLTDNSQFLGVSENVSNASYANAGNPSFAANGVGIGLLRSDMRTALPLGQWVIIEMRNLDLSAWTSIRLSGYGAYMLNGDIAGIILCPAGDAKTRQKNRQYLGNKVGLTLP